ncbi:MAG: 16S rRNA (cytosine(1402)-N(4))-methyltransferase [gamma proteobacterium symbiont of Ctena orbiculata]|uniref:Ribosomal RNA small subunit methyltransferase H n=1 Tax=Candidatus Thiodiazotropha taylori TaxID=2792791 RepID=A0A944MB16_9GAMM|nr:16S rRNA (cytosine(1402)-N(4))-methyltransferase RsmH [Candidatus Thiodiazotropha taylori]PVV15856.1 MAG: 16S rRNA (cytosine(1402)-N(4))-methyltransferase [gamma proteobacterium symbiont of Ctena orbiculata]MBT2987780.1 16S rRNA (cytosine(1402)-N(4))-methyltransferase RsmH [Candidatus Thiodiazotropha taylori]MBT2995833.1 16S rRNA (cytosine(1402)-N(4))-methyltransferase RsmH [Candidatus Thiodiazotropha taylori]MBT2999148.1 16S rRNA (cytosine(1402)-N(4))-methyltransferase RsmH [Candidatus Thio
MKQDHDSVLLQPAIEALKIDPGGIYIDGTFGRGGHSRRILLALGDQGQLLAIDRDPEAVAYGRRMFGQDARFRIVQESFAMLGEVSEQAGLMGRVNGILLDLGVSSPQLDQAGRGFSFTKDGPLDMRMDPGSGLSAAEWLARAEMKQITEVLKTYGEERHAKRIARAIVEARKQAPITSTLQLAEIVSRANPAWEKNKHPATRSFQAIRIHVNAELEALQRALRSVLDVLAIGGRLAVISFHSLEDRIVKRFMREQAKGDRYPPGVPVTQDRVAPRLRLVGKALRPSDEETAVNPRARSAVLRVAERLS